ncbi:MAG: hypothetical protein GY915_01705 [bacterium]|nr:hypothetical protein [bacterium]
MALGTWAAALALAEMVPTIFKWIGGGEDDDSRRNSKEKSQDFGDIAGYVVEIAKRISGVDHAGEAVNSIQGNKRLFLQFQKRMVDLERELIAAALKDRIDARSRDMHMLKLGHHNRRADIMVIAASVGLSFIRWFLSRSSPRRGDRADLNSGRDLWRVPERCLWIRIRNVSSKNRHSLRRHEQEKITFFEDEEVFWGEKFLV